MLFLGRRSEQQAAPNSSSLVLGSDTYRPSGAVLGRLDEIAERRTCANLQCTTTWTAPWRNRRRPIFEGQWGCSGRCVLELVRAAIRREMGDATHDSWLQHRHRVPLGLLLLGQGWITQSQLQQGLTIQRERGGRIGEILVSECGVEPEKVTRGLGLQWSCPVLDTSAFSPRAMALVAPKIFTQQFGLLPIRVAGSRILYLGFEDRLDAASALALEQMTGLKVESGLIETEEYRAARKNLLENEGVPLRQESCDERDAMASRVTAILEQKQPLAAKLIRLHHSYWLRLWLEASDIARQGMLPVHGEDMLDYVFSLGRQI
ncbi:MAG TPA: hypothetical protein VGG95_03055 [Edaphobacter sp.]